MKRSSPRSPLTAMLASLASRFIRRSPEHLKHTQVTDTWSELAHTKGWSTSRAPHDLVELRAEIEQIRVSVYPHLPAQGKRPCPYTHIVAALPADAALFIKLLSKHTSASAEAKLRFEEMYHIESNDERLARLWLDEHSSSLLMAMRPYTFHLSNNELLLVREELEEDPQRLEEAVQVAVHLARRGLILSQQWSCFAAALGAERTEVGALRGAGLAELRVEHRGVAFMIRVESSAEQGACTAITARAAHASLRLSEGERAPATRPGGPQRACIEMLQGLPLLSLEAGSLGLRLVLRGFAPPLEVMRQALDASALLCAQSQGPYR